MPRISIDNYDTVASWNGSQDLFVVEQPDGTKVATPAMVKQFMEAGDFEATGEVKDGHGNVLAEMAKSEDVDDAINAALDNSKIATFKQSFSNISITSTWGSLYVSPELTFDISSLGLQSAPKSVSLEVKATSAPTVMTVINNFNASSIKFFIAMPASYPNVTVDISVLVVYVRE